MDCLEEICSWADFVAPTHYSSTPPTGCSQHTSKPLGPLLPPALTGLSTVSALSLSPLPRVCPAHMSPVFSDAFAGDNLATDFRTFKNMGYKSYSSWLFGDEDTKKDYGAVELGCHLLRVLVAIRVIT